MLQNYDDLTEYGEMELKVLEMVDRESYKGKKQANIHNVNEVPIKEVADKELYRWDDYGGFIAMAVPEAKRQRTEEEPETEGAGEAASGGGHQRGQSKGAGKKGPAQGCFECGGPHYAAQCPHEARAKGRPREKETTGCPRPNGPHGTPGHR